MRNLEMIPKFRNFYGSRYKSKGIIMYTFFSKFTQDAIVHKNQIFSKNQFTGVYMLERLS